MSLLFLCLVFLTWKSKMKKLRMAIMEGCKNGKLPSRPETRVIRNGKQDQLIFENVVPPVKKRNSKVYFLKASWDKPNAWNTWTLLSIDDWFLIVLELERPLAIIRVNSSFYRWASWNPERVACLTCSHPGWYVRRAPEPGSSALDYCFLPSYCVVTLLRPELMASIEFVRNMLASVGLQPSQGI